MASCGPYVYIAPLHVHRWGSWFETKQTERRRAVKGGATGDDVRVSDSTPLTFCYNNQSILLFGKLHPFLGFWTK